MLNIDSLGGFSSCKNFNLHIIDRKIAENYVADNLSRMENVLDDPLPIDDSFPDEQLVVINAFP